MCPHYGAGTLHNEQRCPHAPCYLHWPYFYANPKKLQARHTNDGCALQKRAGTRLTRDPYFLQLDTCYEIVCPDKGFSRTIMTGANNSWQTTLRSRSRTGSRSRSRSRTRSRSRSQSRGTLPRTPEQEDALTEAAGLPATSPTRDLSRAGDPLPAGAAPTLGERAHAHQVGETTLTKTSLATKTVAL